MSTPSKWNPEDDGALCSQCIMSKLRDGDPVKSEFHDQAIATVVAEGPGKVEVKLGRPLVGPSGMELDETLQSIGYMRYHFNYTNATACKPPGDTGYSAVIDKLRRYNKKRIANGEQPYPTPEDCCRPRLAADLEQAGAAGKKIIALGAISYRTLTGKRTAILEARGAPVSLVPEHELGHGRSILPTMHPAFVLRARRWAGVFRVDLARAIRWFQSGQLGWIPPQSLIRPSVDLLRRYLKSTKIEHYTHDVETTVEGGPLLNKTRCLGIADLLPDGENVRAMVIPFLSIDGVTRFYGSSEEEEIKDLLRDFYRDGSKSKSAHNRIYDELNLAAYLSYKDALTGRRKLFNEFRNTLCTLVMHKACVVELPHRLSVVGSVETEIPGAWKEAHTATEARSDHELHDYNCLFYGTQVRLADGTTEAIERLISKKHPGPVLSWNAERNEIEPRAITGWHCTQGKNQCWLEVKLASGGRILCTPDHGIFTARGKVRADQLTTNDEVLSIPAVLTPIPWSIDPATTRVVSVEPFQPEISRLDRLEMRYCLSVEGNANFFTAGGLVSNCIDLAVQARIEPPLMDRVRQRGQEKVVANDYRVQDICKGLHINGMPIDEKIRQKLEKSYTDDFLKLEAETLAAARAVGTKYTLENARSSAQIKELIFGAWNVAPATDVRGKPILTKTGAPSAAYPALLALRRRGDLTSKQIHFIDCLRKMKKKHKLLSAYIKPLGIGVRFRDALETGYDEDDDAWSIVDSTTGGLISINADDEDAEDRLTKKEMAREGRVVNGRAHAGWNVLPKTGRLNCTRPPLQTFPHDLRVLFLAPQGLIWVYADLDQVELRAAIARAQAKRYMQEFQSPTCDPHALAAAMIFGSKFTALDKKIETQAAERKKIRDFVKKFVYSVLYLAEPPTVHRIITSVEDTKGNLLYSDMGLLQVMKLRQNWLNENLEISGWWTACINEYRARGYRQEPMWGRRCDFLDGEASRERGDELKEVTNELVNWDIQPACAAYAHEATFRFVSKVPFGFAGEGTGLCFQGHDALGVLVPVADAISIAQILQEAMTTTNEPRMPGVPFTASAQIGPDLHSLMKPGPCAQPEPKKNCCFKHWYDAGGYAALYT